MAKGIGSKSTPKPVVFERVAIDSPAKRYSLNTLLAQFDPKRHGSEAMAFKPVGRALIPKV